MALISASSTTQILGRAWSLSSTAMRPFTLTGWFRPLATNNQTFVCGFTGSNMTVSNPYAGMIAFGDTAAPNDLAVVADEKDSATTPVEQFIFAYTTGGTTGASAAPLNIWYFGAVVYPSLTSRTAYVFNQKMAAPLVQTGTGTVSTVNFTNFTIGSVEPAAGDLSVMHLAEVAVWNSVLSASDVGKLAQGMNPLRVGAHGSLMSYYPLRGDVKDYGPMRTGLYNLGTAQYPMNFIDHAPVESAPMSRQYDFLSEYVQKRPTVMMMGV